MAPDEGSKQVAAGQTLQAGSLKGLTKIVIAIHGIGNQTRSGTVRSVATRFGTRDDGRSRNGDVPKVPLMPLGYFYTDEKGAVRVSRLDVKEDHELHKIGFAEVYWADIPREVVRREDTLEESKAWGKTIVSRAQAQYYSPPAATKKRETSTLKPADFELVSGALDEIIETVGVLENLCTVAALSGVFKFDLGKLLRDYIGDVQLVTDFSYYRHKILHRFHIAMEQIVAEFAKDNPGTYPEIYIVAHSEGTVVSFLALLQALWGIRVKNPGSAAVAGSGLIAPQAAPQGAATESNPEWIQHVRGFMTIGSPIDKHLVLWPRLWDPELWKAELTDRVQTDTSAAMARAHANPPIPPNPIRWRNYYDLGDPIGFKLDVARDWLEEHGCTAFEFRSEHDMEFSRYWLPGEAHNEYWNDPDVFGHFIDTVVTPKETVTPAPKSKLLGRLSPALPYALSVACHAGAVFVLLKSVLAYSSEHFPLRDVALETAVLTILLAGTTVATRLPRLVKAGWGWGLASVVAFVVGAVVYLTFMPDEVVERLSPPLIKAGLTTETARFAAEYAIVGLAFIVTLIAWLIQRKPRYAHCYSAVRWRWR